MSFQEILKNESTYSYPYPVLTITFSLKLEKRELDYFRAAVIHTAGKEHVLFHNHLKHGYRYGYPLIQYKFIKDKPAIVCLGDGCEEVLSFFNNLGKVIQIKEDTREIAISKINIFRWRFQVLQNSLIRYKVKKWIPLNEHNYLSYKDPNLSEEEKKALLEKILIGNILSMASGIQWRITKRINLLINELSEPTVVKFKGSIPLLAFDCVFTTNVALPLYIGLGKGTSRGFGTIVYATKNARINENGIDSK